MGSEVYGAVIFDMDGVMIHTAPQHFAAWRRVFAEMGRELSEEEFEATFGMRNREVLQHVLGDGISNTQVEELGNRKEEYYRALVRGEVKAAPGFLPLLEALRNNRFRIAVGTSAPPANVELILNELGIRERLDAVVMEGDVEKGKPDPEAFLLAAQWCGVAPEKCVVFEDAVAGVRAAKAAGMRCVGVGKADLAQADLVVDSLEKVTVPVVKSLLDREG
jgi:beta-phosphoglucomutase